MCISGSKVTDLSKYIQLSRGMFFSTAELASKERIGNETVENVVSYLSVPRKSTRGPQKYIELRLS